MLGDDVKVGSKDFQPFLTDHKEGYYELEQLRPGIVLCPHCNALIDVKKSGQLKAAIATIEIFSRSWASVPICNCPGVWAIYDPNVGKWAFRYTIDNGDTAWQTA